MQFSIQREKLLQPLQKIIGAVEKRQSMPILGNALVRIQNNHMFLTATDMEVELQSFTALDGDSQPGETTIPARKLLDIVRTLPDKCEIKIAVNEQSALISSGLSKFKLMCLPSKEFPTIANDVSKVEINLPQKDLRFLIERVYFAIAEQDVRYYLNGLFLEITPKHLRAVAADGHRLAMCTLENNLAVDEIKLIIPRKTIIELLRLLENTEDIITILVTDNHVRIVSKDFIFISKVIDSVYPDYHRVIPTKLEQSIVLPREQLKQLMTRAAILSNEKYRGIKVLLRTDRLIIEAHNNDQEEVCDELAINYQGQELDVGFNVTYILDVVNALQHDLVKVTFSGNNSSLIIEANDDERCFYVIMPMRL